MRYSLDFTWAMYPMITKRGEGYEEEENGEYERWWNSNLGEREKEGEEGKGQKK